MKIRERFREFKAAYDDLFFEMNLNSINWNLFCFLFFVLLPCLLYLLQLLIVAQIIPYPVAVRFFVLSYNDPNFANMFLSNYIHNVFDSHHVYQNVLSSFLTFILLFGYFLLALPYIRFANPGFRWKFNPSAFILVLITIFCFVPFSISGISIYFGKILGKSIGWGYSGVLYALWGFFVYLLVELILSLPQRKAQGTLPVGDIAGPGQTPAPVELEAQCDQKALQSPFIILICTLLPFVVIALILSEMIQPGTGVFGHLGGFMLGFLVSPVIELMTLCNQVRQKMIFCGVLALILVVPAVGWIAAG
jgi:hypothetical protein